MRDSDEGVICSVCDGTGRLGSTLESWSSGGVKCYVCNGTGEIELPEDEDDEETP